MTDGLERPGRWTGTGDQEAPEQQTFNGLELAEVETSPARLEEGGGDLRAEARGGASAHPANPGPATAAPAAPAGASSPATGRRRGGKPRLTEEQDRRITEAFEKAKKEGRSLKDVANELAKELGQPADYINQRYYYLQRKSRAEKGEPEAAPAGRRGRARATAPAPAPEAAPARARGRRGAQAAAPAAPEAGAQVAAAAPAPARAEAAGDLAEISRSLNELTNLTRTQLTAIVDRLQQLESRLSSLEQRPAGGEVPVDQVLERLGQVLQERGRAVRSRERVRAALQEFLKVIEESV